MNVTSVSPEQLVGALAEQQHQLLDLDSDSQCPMPGAVCVACPPREETS
jgi:hypothetical protein